MTAGSLVAICLLPAAAGLAAPLPIGTGTNWTYNAELGLRETWDSNIFLQDTEPDRTKVPQAAAPFQESFVTTVTPRVGIDYRSNPRFAATVGYAPEIAFYHSASSEDYVAHRGTVNLSGKDCEDPWQFANACGWVEGGDEGLYFGAPGGAPALGGIPIRDRRDQFVYRGKLNATWTSGAWFLRPVGSGYWHDFHTAQKDPTDPTQPTNKYYENYIDRRELDLGLDGGRKVGDKTRVYAGYRYGWEGEGDVPGSPYHYDATFHRPTVGIEGQPWKWLKADFSIGPDIHHTIHEVAPGFDRDYTTLWVDGVITLLPTKQDTIVLTWRENTQPAFSSTSVYDDKFYDLAAKHQFGEHWFLSGGFRLYIGDWFSPVNRDDWIYTWTAGVAYRHDAHWSAELAYSYDWVESQVPNTPGREFTRNLVWLGAKWTL